MMKFCIFIILLVVFCFLEMNLSLFSPRKKYFLYSIYGNQALLNIPFLMGEQQEDIIVSHLTKSIMLELSLSVQSSRQSVLINRTDKSSEMKSETSAILVLQLPVMLLDYYRRKRCFGFQGEVQRCHVSSRTALRGLRISQHLLDGLPLNYVLTFMVPR